MQKKRKNGFKLRFHELLLCMVIVMAAVFYFNQPDLGQQTVSFRPAYLTDIKESDYQSITVDSEDIHQGNLILVNNQTEYVFPDDADLASIYDFKNDSYQVKDKNVLLKESTIIALNEMFAGFEAEKGKNDCIIISGYRSYDYQKGLYDKRVDDIGEEEASNWVALPGGSEHHTGMAVDLGLYTAAGQMESYTGKGKYEWLNENAWRYGFIVRYDENKKDLTKISHEPWHFRYIGKVHAALITKLDLCMEEYITYLKDVTYGEKHLLTNDAEIYYIPANGEQTTLFVPTGRNYSISGNNVDGFIITAQIK